MLSAQEYAYWQEQLISSYQGLAATPSIATSCSDKPHSTVYGSRCLIVQSQLDAARMVRHIPRLPLQNAIWLQFAYSPAMHTDLYDQLAVMLHLKYRRQKTSVHAAHKGFVLAALLHKRLSVQPACSEMEVSWQILRNISNSNAKTIAEWRKTRSYDEWRRMFRTVEELDIESIEMLLKLRRSIRNAREGLCQH